MKLRQGIGRLHTSSQVESTWHVIRPFVPAEGSKLGCLNRLPPCSPRASPSPCCDAVHQHARKIGSRRSPLVDLPCPPEEVLAQVDAVIITHMHPDHFEEKTATLMDRAPPLYVQDDADA